MASRAAVPWEVVAVGAGAAVAFLFREQIMKVVLTTGERSRIAKLVPAMQSRIMALKQAMATHGVQLHVGSTLRTSAEEQRHVAEGRASASLKHSWHELGRAADVYVKDPATGKIDLQGKRVELYKLMHEEAAAIGMRGIAFNADGSKKYIQTAKGPVWDAGHLEWRQPFATMAEAWKTEGNRA